MRLRDIAGRKRDLARILDQHRQLVRDTLAGRTLLNALPMPAWFRDAGGRIQWINEAYVKAVEAAASARCASGRSSFWRCASARRRNDPGQGHSLP